MNKVILIGNIGKDPEIRATPNGTQVANFSLATNEKRGGEDQTEWHRCVAFNRQAEVIGEYVRKGSKLAIEGKIQTRKWTDRGGNDRYSTEILVDRFEFVESKNVQDRPAQVDTQAREPGSDDEPFSDDIPF